MCVCVFVCVCVCVGVCARARARASLPVSAVSLSRSLTIAFTRRSVVPVCIVNERGGSDVVSQNYKQICEQIYEQVQVQQPLR